MVLIEGTVEYLADRWALPRGGRAIGVYAYQTRHPDMTVQRLFRSPAQVVNRKIYLACFLDSDDGEYAIAECMRRLERAIRQDEPICDLSDLGDAEAWNTPSWWVLVPWQDL